VFPLQQSGKNILERILKLKSQLEAAAPVA